MPQADDLTLQARRLLAVLRERGDWVSRADLADALGKPKLINYDIRLIEKLAVKGMIEGRRRRTLKKVVIFEYKAK